MRLHGRPLGRTPPGDCTLKRGGLAGKTLAQAKLDWIFTPNQTCLDAQVRAERRLRDTGKYTREWCEAALLRLAEKRQALEAESQDEALSAETWWEIKQDIEAVYGEMIAIQRRLTHPDAPSSVRTTKNSSPPSVPSAPPLGRDPFADQ